jgi:hypothetical protein
LPTCLAKALSAMRAFLDMPIRQCVVLQAQFFKAPDIFDILPQDFALRDRRGFALSPQRLRWQQQFRRGLGACRPLREGAATG